ncbi:MAG: RnfABCDGE type electron transport complex subunit D [Pseudoflavonifractor sp.]|nr:RnfABCDGE type electron transport complex subunit D [Pseudoflavonifractor sp.]
MEQILVISPSPHLHTDRTTRGLMWRVTCALIPALACSLWVFGIGAAIVTATSILACVITEYLINRYMLHRPATIANGTAILTGLLLAFNLPSNLPVWIVAIGAVVAIGIGKMAFGGLGCNIFNPAITGRVFLLLSFPAQMTSWPIPGENTWRYLDASTGATILGAMKTGEGTADMDLWQSAIGMTGGSLGEVGSIALVIGGLYLLVTRVISWHIPVSILATAALLTLCTGGDVALQLLSGGMLLGAIFMATDYVTSPMTHAGMLIYGIGIGAITIIIRHWGSYPEGMSFAILIMNGLTPLINRYVKPRRFGERRAA